MEVIWIKSLNLEPGAKLHLSILLGRGRSEMYGFNLIFVRAVPPLTFIAFLKKKKKHVKIVIHFLFQITWQKFRIQREKLVTTNLFFTLPDQQKEFLGPRDQRKNQQECNG